MWAWHRVDRLLDDERRSGDAGAVVSDRSSSCAKSYSIVSEYASFIVLENDAEYQRWKIERKNEKRMGRDGAALEARREALQQMREEALAQLGPEGVEKRIDEVSGQPANGANQPLAANSPVTPASPAAQPAPRQSRGFDFNSGNSPSRKRRRRWRGRSDRSADRRTAAGRRRATASGRAGRGGRRLPRSSMKRRRNETEW